MDCGIPFCHQGCPLGNLIPEWNDLVLPGQDRRGREAPRRDEQLPRGHRARVPGAVRGVVRAQHPRRAGDDQDGRADDRGPHVHADAARAEASASARTGKRVAVVGSGPAGLAAAQQLARAGHDVTLFERDDRIGGLLRYGIPDFKMEKGIIDARIEQMRAEGVTFRRRRRGRRRASRRAAPARLRRGGPRDGRARAARSADSRARAPRGPLRDGVPRAAEPPHRGGRRSIVAPDPRDGQARRRHRRRRHGLRLRRHLAPSGRRSASRSSS